MPKVVCAENENINIILVHEENPCPFLRGLLPILQPSQFRGAPAGQNRIKKPDLFSVEGENIHLQNHVPIRQITMRNRTPINISFECFFS